MAPVQKDLRAPPTTRSASFDGRSAAPIAAESRQMRRPKTDPDLLSSVRRASPVRTGGSGERKVPAKVLINVTVQRSNGPVQVIASTEWKVDDLVAAVARIYIEEERRPPLPSSDPSAFGLHYSQFSLQSLDSKEKLIGLGSRNFFLCPKATSSAATGGNSETPVNSSPCSNDVEKGYWIAAPWLRFMDFLR